MRAIVSILFVLASGLAATAQMYTGISGLLQTPSAEMADAGDARLGAHYLNGHTLPKKFMSSDCPHFNTLDFYVSLTPFSWIELSYAIIFQKGRRYKDEPDIGYHHKDEFMSFKVRPLKEGRWWPAIAVGSTDFITTGSGKGLSKRLRGGYFGNYYVTATKHFNIRNQTFGATLTYRKYGSDYNRRWNGLVGGVTYRPSFFKDARAIVEWTGSEVNFGIDCLLFRHLMVQASLLDGKYFSGGLCYTVNLF